MSVPGWLRWALALAMVGVVTYHFARILGARRRRAFADGVELDVEATHAGMGLVMAAMLVGTIAPVDGRWLATGFGASTLWFLGRGARGYFGGGFRSVIGPAAQVVGGAAMVFMLVGSVQSAGAMAMPGMLMPGMSMPARSTAWAGVPIAWPRAALVIATVLVAAWGVSRLRSRNDGGVMTSTPLLGAGCQLAMNVTTIYMLMAI